MTYDQLLEDYKEYQITSNAKYENISIQFDAEISKYNKLNDEYTNYQQENTLKINKLEEKLRNLQIEREQYEKNYKKVSEEKIELMKTINDFTDRMSFSFSPKVNSDSTDSK
jgi:chromosome segregation ATPase